MSETLEEMNQRIGSASKLRVIVRIMKLLAASQMKQCEKAALASQHYYKNVELALFAWFKANRRAALPQKKKNRQSTVIAIVFGTDLGLVGPFNDRLSQYVDTALKEHRQKKIFAVGERLCTYLEGAGLPLEKRYAVPQSIKGITPLVHELFADMEEYVIQEDIEFLLFHNHLVSGKEYEVDAVRLLPLDEDWKETLMHRTWPTAQVPEILEGEEQSFFSLMREYLFMTLSRALAESMECENICRFLSMQYAEKNIDDRLSDLHLRFNLFRQTAIDAELFDIIGGFSALTNEGG